jgi:ABC-2 type transport system ATP-binding protein
MRAAARINRYVVPTRMGMIQARDLTKRYGDKIAVDHMSFTVEPGRVTGFLGPNGAGKPDIGL